MQNRTRETGILTKGKNADFDRRLVYYQNKMSISQLEPKSNTIRKLDLEKLSYENKKEIIRVIIFDK